MKGRWVWRLDLSEDDTKAPKAPVPEDLTSSAPSGAFGEPGQTPGFGTTWPRAPSAPKRTATGRPMTGDPAYTREAVKAMTRAVDAEHDFAGWLADVLARVAARKGSSDALTAGRPGSWEASLVDQLVKGTVGYDDEYLPDPERTSP